MKPKYDPEDLKGFEDFLEDKAYFNKNSRKTSQFDGEKLTFLEHENNRLKNIESLFFRKLPNLCQYSNIEHNVKIQRKRNEKMLKQLVEHVIDSDSSFSKKLEKIFNDHYL